VIIRFPFSVFRFRQSLPGDDRRMRVTGPNQAKTAAFPTGKLKTEN